MQIVGAARVNLNGKFKCRSWAQPREVTRRSARATTFAPQLQLPTRFVKSALAGLSALGLLGFMASASATWAQCADAACLTGLGDALHADRLYSQAIPHYRQALAVVERSQGPDHLDVASALVNLGRAMFHATFDTTAEPILRRALDIRSRALGDHLDTIEVLDLIALVRFANAEAVSAEGLMGDAARMRARLAKQLTPR